MNSYATNKKNYIMLKTTYGGYKANKIISLLQTGNVNILDIGTETVDDPNYDVKNDNLINLILKNSHPFPELKDVGLLDDFTIDPNVNRAMIVLGGIRFGGRYPDIIIDKYDFLRASEILGKLPSDCTTGSYLMMIVNKVREFFHTGHAVKFNIVKNMPNVDEAWKNTIDAATTCINEKVFNCAPTDSWDQCAAKKSQSNTFTNIMALPYIVGDCREHAWLSGFLAHVFTKMCCRTKVEKCNKIYRVFYTVSYMMDSNKKEMKRIEDHVFILLLTKNKIYVIDPLYSGVKRDAIVYNNGEAINMEKKQFDGYTCDQDFENALSQNAPILHCGNMYIGKVSMHKIVNIPKIYDGTIKYLTDSNTYYQDNKFEYITLYNRKIKYDHHEDNWDSFNKWCSS